MNSSKYIIIFAVVFIGVSIVIDALILSNHSGTTKTIADSSGKLSTTSTTPTSSPTITSQEAHSNQTADQILQGLKGASLPIGESFTYNASNDDKVLLGRPGQYIGRLDFKDNRISSSDTGANITVSDGGSLEVFANSTDATNRYNLIHSISTSSSMFAEYEYLDGDAILRISSQLTPTQAQVYQNALKSLP